MLFARQIYRGGSGDGGEIAEKTIETTIELKRAEDTSERVPGLPAAGQARTHHGHIGEFVVGLFAQHLVIQVKGLEAACKPTVGGR